MDKLKPYLKQIKKYHFWIILGFIVLIAPGAWFYATGQLKSQTDSRRAAIESSYQKSRTVASYTDPLTGQNHHPNDTSEQGMDKFITQLRQDIAAAWQLRYDQQTKELVWPKELREQFINTVKDLRPIEQKFPEFPTPDEKEIDIYYRELYQNYIEKELPKLAEKIGAVWAADSASTGGGRGGRFGGGIEFGGAGGQDNLETESVVEWDPGNQADILANHFTFDLNDDDPTPTTMEVLYAQEDLWVLQTLVDIIRRTNGDADARHKAAVRRIDALLIGRSATTPIGMVTAVQPAAAEGEGETGQPGAIPIESEGGRVPPGGEGLEGGPGEANLEDPAESRYVDLDYKPLSAQALRDQVSGAVDPEKSSKEDAFLAVAKRVPVRMFLRMDQRKINKLLVECGNSALTVEVRQVRISRNEDLSQPLGDASAAPGAGRGFGLESGFSGRGGSGRGSSGRGGRGGGEVGLGGSGMGDDAFPYDVNVEIYGIVFIYNPVAYEVLAVNLNSDSEIESTDDVNEIVEGAPDTDTDTADTTDNTAPPTDPMAEPDDPMAEPADPMGPDDPMAGDMPADDDAVAPEPVDDGAGPMGEPADPLGG